MNLIKWFKLQKEKLLSWWHGDFTVETLTGDTLPKSFNKKILIHMIDGGTSWSAGLNCPCECGEVIELMLLENVKPRWDISIDHLNRPTLHPSVWRSTGCKSHFWIKKGRVHWV